MADERGGGGLYDGKDCDMTPVKFPFHDTVLYLGDTCWLINPEPQERLVWTFPFEWEKTPNADDSIAIRRFTEYGCPSVDYSMMTMYIPNYGTLY
ncbi:MAG: hypothetical protein K2I84_03400, partial [Bacteroidales bacterium]|nr:hypothetical protein [Bacteroidales bacterium]